MKLSEAIEAALQTSYYNSVHYMCCALKDINQGKHVSAVMVMVQKVAAQGTYHYVNTMWSALSWYREDNCLPDPSQDDVKQLYVWWVFDLKRKGL